jgi:hypothetical protein
VPLDVSLGLVKTPKGVRYFGAACYAAKSGDQVAYGGSPLAALSQLFLAHPNLVGRMLPDDRHDWLKPEEAADPCIIKFPSPKGKK